MFCVTAWIWLSVSSAFNLYKSADGNKRTTELFDRLKYFEVIRFRHNQFQSVDSGPSAVYPMNGRLSFTAFGFEHRLLVRKNLELFSSDFHTVTVRRNSSTLEMERIVERPGIPQCYYSAEMDNDPYSEGRIGVFSACRGQGIRGWIKALNETLVIRPKRLLTDVGFTGRHGVDDEHIIYRYGDVDRSGYPHHEGAT